jgi:hypothetical protein
VKELLLGVGPTPTFIVTYQDRNPELWRDASGAAVTQLGSQLTTNTMDFFIPNPDALFLRAIYDNGSVELRRRDTGEVFPLRATPIKIMSSTDLDAGVLYVDYADGTADLIDVATGEAKPLPQKPQDITLGNALIEPFFALRYADQTAEVRSTATGEVIRSFDQGNIVSVYPVREAPAYFRVVYADKSSEIWSAATQQQLVAFQPDHPDYGVSATQIGSVRLLQLIYANGSIDMWRLGDTPRRLPTSAGDARLAIVTTSEQYVVASTQERQLYLLDLPWLEAMGGDAAKLSEADLLKLACTPERAGGVDQAALMKELAAARADQPQACQ